MPRVSDTVAHILFHVEAEAATSDPSQVAGVAGRAQQIRDLLEPFKTDARNLTRKQLLVELRGTTDLVLRAVLTQIDSDDDGRRLQLVLAEWVGRNSLV